MTIGSFVFAGLLAMAPNWAVVDIPYPEADGTGIEPVAGSAEAAVWESLASYARSRSTAPLRKSDIVVTRIDGNKATARVTRGGHTEVVYLEHSAGAWKVVRTE
ncbi:MAG: hypothetical protein ABIQ72_01135 [Usitatibacter sp.]